MEPRQHFQCHRRCNVAAAGGEGVTDTTVAFEWIGGDRPEHYAECTAQIRREVKASAPSIWEAKRLHFVIHIERGPDGHWRCGNVFLGMDGAMPLDDATALVNVEGLVNRAIVETGCYRV